MTKLSWTQRLYWRYFSKPVTDRPVMLHLIKNPVSSILEIGIGSASRTKSMLSLAQLPEGVTQLRYAGVDMFESAEDGREHIKLKNAHRLLAEKCVRAHLMPGDLASALPRLSRTVHPSELVIIDGGWNTDTPDGQALVQWLPRLASSTATVFACAKPGEMLQVINVPQQTPSRQAA
jgi:hypothetical protein